MSAVQLRLHKIFLPAACCCKQSRRWLLACLVACQPQYERQTSGCQPHASTQEGEAAQQADVLSQALRDMQMCYWRQQSGLTMNAQACHLLLLLRLRDPAGRELSKLSLMMGAKGPKVAYLLRQRQLGLGGVQQSCGESKPSQHSQLAAWAETDLLRRCCAAYCQLVPAPRSTIALAFSHDGRLLASSQCAFPHLHVPSFIGIASAAQSRGLIHCMLDAGPRLHFGATPASFGSPLVCSARERSCSHMAITALNCRRMPDTVL